ncbi:hypothetical protein O3P69_013816 [Scylla paramamosain]|uniref:Uncharacterized protein n=1 Tax=Scylla paramamosain TaxID=85552 RepID=A0AAW0ST89_SCYPA
MHRRVQQVAADERHTSTPSDLVSGEALVQPRYRKLSELHVYTLPQDKWIPFRRLARNTVVEETVSAGFVRVPHDLTLADLRHELRGQLIDEDLPEHYVFIKCVGRNFTQVKPHQEYVVKVKNFLPPRAEEPEIHILEISEALLRYAPSLSNILVSDNEISDSQTHGAASQPSSRLQHYELFRKLDNSVNEDGENELDGNVEGGYARGQRGKGWGGGNRGADQDRWGDAREEAETLWNENNEVLLRVDRRGDGQSDGGTTDGKDGTADGENETESDRGEVIVIDGTEVLIIDRGTGEGRRERRNLARIAEGRRASEERVD